MNKICIVFKRGLGNFEYDKRRCSNVERPKSTYFRNNRQTPKYKGNFYGKMAQKEAFCFARHSNKRNMKCHNCGTLGHLVEDCRKPIENEKYSSVCKMNNHDRRKSRKFENGTVCNESTNLLREMNSIYGRGILFFASGDENF